ncbi:alpha/beta-hydrolase [Meredithblackwellia eburnea MCA 4105]
MAPTGFIKRVFLALGELLVWNRTSFRARLVSAMVRWLDVKQMRWGSPAVVKAIVDNKTPVKAPPELLNDPEIVTTESELASGLVNCPLFTFAPAGETKVNVLFLHGGGYVHQPGPPHWAAVNRLVKTYSAKVTFPVYPKGPTYTYKDAYPPVLAVARSLASEEKDLVFIGDSAGGGFTAGILLQMRDEGIRFPKHAFLISPWVDLVMDGPEIQQQNLADPWLNIEGLPVAARMWAGEGTSLKEPLVSPYYASLHSLPPITQFIGTRELIFYDQRRFWDKLQQAGNVGGQSIEVVGAIHDYALAPSWESEQAWKVMGEVLKGV